MNLKGYWKKLSRVPHIWAFYLFIALTNFAYSLWLYVISKTPCSTCPGTSFGVPLIFFIIGTIALLLFIVQSIINFRVIIAKGPRFTTKQLVINSILILLVLMFLWVYRAWVLEA